MEHMKHTLIYIQILVIDFKCIIVPENQMGTCRVSRRLFYAEKLALHITFKDVAAQ